MIIGLNSPLLRIPPQLNRRQILFFDGIRFSMDMTESDAFWRERGTKEDLPTTINKSYRIGGVR